MQLDHTLQLVHVFRSCPATVQLTQVFIGLIGALIDTWTLNKRYAPVTHKAADERTVGLVG